MATPQPTVTAASSAFRGVCSAPMVIGRPVIRPWSLPNATFEPQNETLPMIAAAVLKIAMYVASWA